MEFVHGRTQAKGGEFNVIKGDSCIEELCKCAYGSRFREPTQNKKNYTHACNKSYGICFLH